MRIVITGASGNVGTAILRRLSEGSPGHEIVGVVRRPPEPRGLYAAAQWHALDIADQDAAVKLRPIVKDADAVIHLAWGFQPTRNTDYLTRIGVGGTSAVLEAILTTGGGHLLHMSSVGAYAPGRYGRTVDESWPTDGIASSAYSRDKSAAEAVLDTYESASGDDAVAITRMRPGFIVQRAAASGLMRYALPGYVPMISVPWLPLMPMDRRLCIPLVHADDVADAFIRAVERRVAGPFNLAAEPPLTREKVAEVLGAKSIQVPSGLLGVLVDLTWRARLQPIDRGWLDLAFSVPLLDCTRAHTELDWQPRWSATDALADVLEGIRQQAHSDSPPLRRRSMVEQLQRDIRDGPMTTRHIP